MMGRTAFRLIFFAALCAALLSALLPTYTPGPDGNAASTVIELSALPPQAVETLELILRDGPFPYRKDGSTFFNREGLLPDHPRGYYREYTVPMPGAPDRGARRIVTGGNPPEVFYYTADHYRSFRRIEGVR